MPSFSPDHRNRTSTEFPALGEGQQLFLLHLLPELHDRGGGILQGHMAVVAHVQFLELHTALCSGNKTENTGGLTWTRAESWNGPKADGAQGSQPWQLHNINRPENTGRRDQYCANSHRGGWWHQYRVKVLGARDLFSALPTGAALLDPSSLVPKPSLSPLPHLGPLHGTSPSCSVAPVGTERQQKLVICEVAWAWMPPSLGFLYTIRS